MIFKDYVEERSVKLPWSGCRIWMGAVTHGGYGRSIQAQHAQGTTIVHRALYQELNGRIDPKMYVCHWCDTPSCVNPDHLFAGTPSDNAQDRKRKGRSAPTFGEYSGRSKLRNVDIPRIKYLLSQGVSQKKISLEFGVNQSAISRIKRNVGWRNV
jgi:hypothetical protein